MAALTMDSGFSCNRECNQQSDCDGFLFSSALSECILMSVPSICTSQQTPDGYQYYEKTTCTTNPPISLSTNFLTCGTTCTLSDKCHRFLFSAALSDCVIMTAPPICTSPQAPDGYTFYKKLSCANNSFQSSCYFNM